MYGAAALDRPHPELQGPGHLLVWWQTCNSVTASPSHLRTNKPRTPDTAQHVQINLCSILCSMAKMLVFMQNSDE